MRVIGGQLRSRRLARPPPGVRPTSDRVRESLFSQLEPLAGLRVLDLYAGTGALGIEALSRGAGSVTFVDRAPRSIAVLRENLASLELSDRATVLKCDVGVALRRLRKGNGRFDLVFADPPYDLGSGGASSAISEFLGALVESRLLAPDALVVVESATRHPLTSVEGLVDRGVRVFGDTQITWLSPRNPHQPRSDE